ncbi:MAG: T9SS type A sorting domain-containing protein [Bacteroidetes bacterium]|nr:T9SS type A sorting domain-containing protein [Bacteroidota bacterium]
MKIFSSIFVFAVSLVLYEQALFAQTLEPIGGPYTADSNTVLLLHFDGDYANAAATLGKTAAAAIPHSTNLATKLSFLNQSGPLAGLGKSLRIDNSSINDSTYLTVADTAAFDMTGNWTIEAWANIFTFGSGSSDYRWVPRVVMKPGDDVFWHPNYWLEMWGDARLFHGGYYTSNDAFISVTSPDNMFVPGEWVHLTFIRDTSRAFIAVMVHDANKNLKGFLTRGFDKVQDIPNLTAQDLHIGWAGSKKIVAPSTDSWLDGFVDEIRISNVIRNFAGPPVIQSATLLPNQPSTATSYPVEISVFPLNAGGSMTNVEVKYRSDTLSAFSSVTLSSTGDNKYTGDIPAQAFGKQVQYYYATKDNNNLTSLSPSNAEDLTNPSYYAFWVFQPYAKTLDLTFEEGPSGNPIDHSSNNATITTFVDFKYSIDIPVGGGTYSLDVKATDGIKIDSNWVTATSPFLAAEEFTLDCWLKPDSANRPYVRIIINPSAEQDWNNANFELSFRPGAAGENVFTARYWKIDGSGTVAVQDTLPAQTTHVGKWRHVIIERNKTNGNFAMVIKDENDQLMFSKTVNEMKAPLMAGAPMVIGRSWFLTDDQYYVGPYRGLIDNVTLYNYPAANITGVSEELEMPNEFKLLQNYPNPFNPSTVIEFTLPKFQQVSLVIYDILGRSVKTLVNEERHAGQHRVTWNSTNNLGLAVSSGVYFYEMKTSDMVKVRKMMLLR